MLDMAKQSAILFLQGKLFQDQAAVWRQLGIGIALTLAIFLICAKALGLPLPLAAALAGLVGGGAQPALFQKLKFR